MNADYNVKFRDSNAFLNQKILTIDIDKNEYFLKTIIPSRKATKKYLGGQNG